MAILKVFHGDIVHDRADALVCSANPWLRLTGGVGASLREAAGDGIEKELQSALRERNLQVLEPGTIIETGPALAFQAVLHAVAIDGRYHSGETLLRRVLQAAFQRCLERGLLTVALPALATGYGNYPMIDFLLLLRSLVPQCGLKEIHLYLSREEHVEMAEIVFALGQPGKPIQPTPPGWRLLLMVEVLHTWGYERLRIVPLVSPSGMHWRCGLTNSSNLSPDGTQPLTKKTWVQYSSSEGDVFFGWTGTDHYNSAHLAARFLADFSGLAEAARGADPEYARWYRERLLRSCGPENLPVYAFDECENLVGLTNREGYEIAAPPAASG